MGDFTLSTVIDKTLLFKTGIDDTLLAEAGIDNTLLAEAGIDQYHYRLKPVSIIQYGRYIDTIESSEVSIGCLVR